MERHASGISPLLTDFIMPGMEARELAAVLAEIGLVAPVLCMTGAQSSRGRH